MSDNKPDLNYIDTDVLNTWDEKYRGYFVYLREGNKNGLKPGLFFGGVSGWERLSNIEETPFVPSSNVPCPIKDENKKYGYNGEEHVFVPSNWDEISKYVYMYNNTHTDAGTYDVLFVLKYSDWAWDCEGDEDEKRGSKILSFTIEPEHVETATVVLSSQTWTYGEELPYVTGVMYQGYMLVKGKDYEVVYPEMGGNTIIINFINNYTGQVKKTFTINRKRIPVPVFGKTSYPYTGDTVTILPTNWDEISSYCKISNNSESEIGEYELTITIKNPNMYCWNNENGDSNPIYKTFTIGSVEVPRPVWSDNEALYSFVYDGTQHSIYPLNWDEIKEYVSITGNEATVVGDYIAFIRLNEGCKWEGESDNSDNSLNANRVFHSKRYRITRFMVDRPIWSVKNVKTYNGDYFTYIPLNWNEIEEYCEIRNNSKINAGVWNAVVYLKDKGNYGWEGVTGEVINEDMTGEFTIKKAEGFFIVNPYLHGNFYAGDYVNCVCQYVDSTCTISYEWYRSTTGSLTDNSTYITTTDDNEYRITKEDVGHFIVCKVVVSSTDKSNYTGMVATVVSRMKVMRTIVYDNLRFEDDKYSDTVGNLLSIYTLPEVLGIMPDDDESVLEYKIIQGSDIAQLHDIHTGVLYLTGSGDVVVEVTVKGSEQYMYSPDNLRFTLHVYSGEMVYWGLYDKNGNPNEEELLKSGIVPDDAKLATLKSNDRGYHALLMRKDFPFRNHLGEEQTYFGWYVLIPAKRELLEVCENSGANFDPKDVQIKTDDGEELIIEKNGKEYKVYGKFNKAITSNNWMLHIMFENRQGQEILDLIG